MALLFFDGFDHYNGGVQSARKWSQIRNTVPTTVTGRNGPYAWSGAERWWQIDFASNYVTLIVGGAFKMSRMNITDAIVSLKDGGTLQCELRFNPTSNLFYLTRNGTTIGANYSLVPVLNQWYFIELKATIDNTVGSMEVKIDGTTRINSTGLDTQQSTNAYVNQVRIGSAADLYYEPDIDDFYICDTSGSAPQNDFLGDVRIETLYPTGNGTTSQLDGSDGNQVDNYLLVDENPDADDDTTYVESGDVGDKDTYAYGNLVTTGGTVYGVQLLPTIKKTDAGARSAKAITRLSAVEEDGAEQVLGTNYALVRDIRQTKPGGGAWTIDDINNAEFGMKVFS